LGRAPVGQPIAKGQLDEGNRDATSVDDVELRLHLVVRRVRIARAVLDAQITRCARHDVDARVGDGRAFVEDRTLVDRGSLVDRGVFLHAVEHRSLGR
jgi:hypothetical protein